MQQLSWCVMRRLFLAVLCASGVRARQVLYVAVDGKDTNPGTQAKPFATLERARDQLRKTKHDRGATVFVRGGTYYLPRTFRLEARDSGAPGAPVVYRAFGDEPVVLSGGRPITNFVPHEGAVLKADLKAQGFPEYRFRQLFFNDERQHLARYPDFDPENPITGGWAFVPGEYVRFTRKKTEETLEERRTMKVKPEDIREWARPGEGSVMVLPHHNWWNHIVPIASVDKEKGIVTLGRDPGFDARLGDRRFGMKGGDRFYFRGFFEELDAPGEWYLDERTWTLYFQPPGPMENAVVTVPAMRRVIYIAGGASHITLRGFTIECSDMEAVFLAKTDHCRVEKCVIRNAMEYSSWSAAVRVEGANNAVVGCDIYSVGSTGLSLDGGDRKTLAPGKNVADNNYIHHTGVFYKAGSGISCAGVGNRVSHNLIHDTPRQGIRWNGNDHLIEYNRLRHTNTQISDTGAINACNASWTKRGTVIRYNYIRDALGFGKNSRQEWVSPYYCWGIYLDNITCGVTVFGNILVRLVNGGAFIHGGRDNLVANNIFIDGGTRQMTYSSWKPDPGQARQRMAERFAEYASLPAYGKYAEIQPLLAMTMDDRLRMAGNRFVRNILYYSGADAMLYGHRNLDVATTESDYNLIWHFGDPLLTERKGTAPPEKQWSIWKSHGFEKHTLVVDPLFVDPQNDDYRLRPDSPAFELGFERIPVEKIGPYESPLRVSWPIVQAEGVREHPIDVGIMPRPPEQAASGRPLPVFVAPRLETPIVIDGDVARAEWEQVNMRRGITLKEDVRGRIVTPISYVWVTHDDQFLYVAFRNRVDPKTPLETGTEWGRNDAVEVAIRNPDAKGAPIFVLRGFPEGQFRSTTEAGASPAEAAALARGVKYGARIVSKDHWTAEWRIPLAALKVEPSEHPKLLCNFTVRKTASDLWLMWRATRASSWRVDQAAYLALGRETKN